MENNRNFFITIALSVLILALWQYFYVLPRSEQQREAARIEQQRVEEQKKAAEAANPGAATPAPAPGAIPNAPGGDVVTAAGRDQALATSKRVKIDTPSVEGSINLTGARLDDLKLKHYTETVDKNS
ncbi:membrane protein insertase YidC, partial [Mesorhizobium sp. M2D.F.Ca.ET.145.01.1.1]